MVAVAVNEESNEVGVGGFVPYRFRVLFLFVVIFPCVVYYS